jgi:hypothetical protein
VKSPFCATSVNIDAAVDCYSKNLVYVILTEKENCKQIYIGKKRKKIERRLAEYKSSVRNCATNVIGVHFNGPGHSV